MNKSGWHEIREYAFTAGARFPEVVAAQWALESGWGAHESGKNNVFGIKGEGTLVSTQEWNGEKFIDIKDNFKDYESVEACVKDLVGKWYKDYKNFKGVNRASTREECARLLVTEQYATDPSYAQKLIGLMNQMNQQPSDAMKPSGASISLCDAAKYYKGLAHQEKAWKALEASLSQAQLVMFAALYRDSQDESSEADLNSLEGTPYFYQRDSKTGHGERMCQSSAIAMAIKYLEPTSIYDDDEYISFVFDYGDTVSASAHVEALRSLGIPARFRTDGTEQALIDLLNSNIPVPIGILHKGHITHVSGGGHWVTLIGYTDTDFIVHDPFGNLDLVAGFYKKTGPKDGCAVKYDRKNLMKRWLIASNCDGWYWDFS